MGVRRSAIGSCVAAALLAGCGVGSSPIGAPATIPQRAAHGTKTFSYTGAEQNFTVPRGVTQLTVVAIGASGPSGGGSYCYYTGGNGGVIKATIPVISGETLSVYVGGEGIGAGSNCSPGGAGGFNGGGNGGGGISGGANGTGGGGASDVREGGDTLADRVLVSGGGGGGGQTTGFYGAGAGGAGGGRVGGNGGTEYKCSPAGFGGKGGRHDVGGKGGRGGQRGCSYFQRGAHGYRGALAVGGEGGSYARNGYSGGGGGGGGGGYYGGGGGGAGSWSTSGIGGGGGGGGGSSYAEPSATRVKDQRGAAPPGNGQVVIAW
ncbi:MAG: hypothetical protein WB526_07255 [Candidatus Cybelea sp.]